MVAMCQVNGCNLIPWQPHIWWCMTTGLPGNSHALNNSMLSFARRAHHFVNFQGNINDAGVFALASCFACSLVFLFLLPTNLSSLYLSLVTGERVTVT